LRGFKGCDMLGIGICIRSGQGMQTRSLCAGRGAGESADSYSSSLIKCLGKLDMHCVGLVHAYAWPPRDVSRLQPLASISTTQHHILGRLT
jgi:hypothetical protein